MGDKVLHGLFVPLWPAHPCVQTAFCREGVMCEVLCGEVPLINSIQSAQDNKYSGL
jgi:hypothetical protein